MPDAKDIFLRALEISSTEERAAYLETACVDHPGVRAKVDALLVAHDDPESYLERPAARFDVTATTDGSGRGSDVSDSSSHHDPSSQGVFNSSTVVAT